MDANELNGVLEDVREFIAVLRTGERQYVETLTEAAAENKIAAKAIGHIIEQHLLKTDPAYKIGALLLIDSICQNVGEPYVSYFSTSIGKMFGEVWKNSGQTTRERMKRWVQMYQEKGVFPPEAIASIKSQIEPGGAAKQAAPAHATGRADPRRARPQASLLQSPVYVPQPPAYAQPSAHVASAPPMPAYNPAYGTPAQPMQSWHPQPSLPPPPMARPMYPPRPAPGGTPADPLQQYRDAQRNAALHGVAPYQPAFAPRPPLGATFRGVRLQDHHPEALLFLNEVTRKIKTYLNDKRIARERARREGTAATSRRWFAPAEMWVQGAVAAESAAPEQPANEEKDQKPEEAKRRFTVIKDDRQPRCAICAEPFAEEWDEEAQEWVYVDAIRLPDFIAKNPAVKLEPGSIVKVGVLPPGFLPALEEHLGKGGGKGAGAKRKGEFDGGDGPPVVKQALGVKLEDVAPVA